MGEFTFNTSTQQKIIKSNIFANQNQDQNLTQNLNQIKKKIGRKRRKENKKLNQIEKNVIVETKNCHLDKKQKLDFSISQLTSSTVSEFSAYDDPQDLVPILKNFNEKINDQEQDQDLLDTQKKKKKNMKIKYDFKEANYQLHEQNPISLFDKSLSTDLIYAKICSFLDPHKKSVNHAQICVSMSQINRLCSETSRQWFKMQKPSPLQPLTRNFTNCMPYINSGLDEHGYSVELVRRTCLENAETWLYKGLMSSEYDMFNILLATKDKHGVFFIEGIVNDEESEGEEEEGVEDEQTWRFFTLLLTKSWPSVLKCIPWLTEAESEKYEDGLDGFTLDHGDFTCLLSSWLKEDPLNTIIVLAPFPCHTNDKWRRGPWLWNVKCWKQPHWDPDPNNRYCYAADLFEPLHQEEKKKKRKNALQTT